MHLNSLFFILNCLFDVCILACLESEPFEELFQLLGRKVVAAHQHISCLFVSRYRHLPERAVSALVQVVTNPPPIFEPQLPEIIPCVVAYKHHPE